MQGLPPLFPPSNLPAPSTFPAPALLPAPRSLRDVAAVLYRQAGLILVCTVLVTLVAWALYAQQPRVFTSSAKVWVQTEQQGSPSFLSGIAAYRETPYPDPVNRKIETEIELMLTRTNAQAVVERLNIQDGQLARGSFGKLRAELGALFGGSAEPAPGHPGRARTVDLFLDNITIEPLRSKTADTTSNVLEVKFECTDAALAPRALQAFIDNYLQLGAQQNRRLGETTSRLIESKLEQARGDLRRAEDDIVTLLVKDSNRALPVSAGDTRSSSGAGAPPPILGGLRLDPNPDTLSPGSPAQVVSTLKSQTLDLQLRLDEARQQFTDDADNVKNLRARLDTTRHRLAVTVRENTQLEVQLNRLERQRTLAQERYLELQRKLDQIDLYLKLNPTESESRVVIDAPYRPAENEGKKRPLVAVLGPLAGLLLGLLLAGLLELTGERMRTPREAEWALGVPVLGAIPTLSAKARLALVGTAFTGAPIEPLAAA